MDIEASPWWEIGRQLAVKPNDQAQRPPPETPGRLQESLTNCLNHSPEKRGGGSLERTG
jgi:hypothetical protein